MDNSNRSVPHHRVTDSTMSGVDDAQVTYQDSDSDQDGDEVHDDIHSRAVDRILKRGLSVSTSILNLANLQLPSTDDSKADIPSPKMHSPHPAHSKQQKEQLEQQHMASFQGSDNPCFPNRSNMTLKQSTHIKKALVRQGSLRNVHPNTKLGNSEKWNKVMRHLSTFLDQQVPPLLQRVSALIAVVDSRKNLIVSPLVIKRLTLLFDDITNVTYILQNSVFRVSFNQSKPQKMSMPEADGDNPDDDFVNETLGLIRYSLGRIPERWEELSTCLKTLDDELVNYDEKIPLERLDKITRYIEEAHQVLSELMGSMSARRTASLLNLLAE